MDVTGGVRGRAANMELPTDVLEEAREVASGLPTSRMRAEAEAKFPARKSAASRIGFIWSLTERKFTWHVSRPSAWSSWSCAGDPELLKLQGIQLDEDVTMLIEDRIRPSERKTRNGAALPRAFENCLESENYGSDIDVVREGPRVDLSHVRDLEISEVFKIALHLYFREGRLGVMQ